MNYIKDIFKIVQVFLLQCQPIDACCQLRWEYFMKMYIDTNTVQGSLVANIMYPSSVIVFLIHVYDNVLLSKK